jgi:hypothetical protein
MDILSTDVIRPLETLKVSQEDLVFGRHPCSNGNVIWKEVNDKRRKIIKNNLKTSASRYADYAENRVWKLQQAHSRKYQPQQYTHSANVSQRPQDVPDKRLRRKARRKVSALSRSQQEDL